MSAALVLPVRVTVNVPGSRPTREALASAAATVTVGKVTTALLTSETVAVFAVPRV